MIETTRTSDLNDMAAEAEQVAREAALSNRVRYTGVSPLTCYQCGMILKKRGVSFYLVQYCVRRVRSITN
ncbi:hypothetical protein [Escherichia phage AV127]|nr:hypothetical protein [Escherichia phage AV127]